ncbi:MAG: hypothetical protein OEV08_14500 [Nitrospira sp.]|nr:hypothetical protein [Nitrospira sp.]
MSLKTQTISLIALSAIWLVFVIPGTTGERGVNWDALITVGLLPVGVLWAVFLYQTLKKKAD